MLGLGYVNDRLEKEKDDASLLDHSFQRNAFFDEHDGNIFSDRVQYLPVASDQPSVERLRDRLIRPIF
jgi:hypothetical protein